MAGGGSPAVSGVDREDRGARKRREAEGEGGLAGRRKARGREPVWRACASPGREEGRSARAGAPKGGRGGGSAALGARAHRAVSSGREAGRESNR